MARLASVFICSFALLFMSSCSDNSSSKEADYDTTKEMIIDILQTDEGKSAMSEILADEKMKQHLVIESDVVKDSINETLVSEKGSDMWRMLFKDPTFVQDFATSMEESHEGLLKSLMNDADYQQQMIDILQNPEINEQMLQLMKSQEYRSFLQETIQETLETPLFQAQMAEILLKAAEEQEEKQQDESNDENEDDNNDDDENKEDDDNQGGESDPNNTESH